MCAFLILGHQAAIAGWLVRFHDDGVWLTAVLITDAAAVGRALLRCEEIAFG